MVYTDTSCTKSALVYEFFRKMPDASAATVHRQLCSEHGENFVSTSLVRFLINRFKKGKPPNRPRTGDPPSLPRNHEHQILEEYDSPTGYDPTISCPLSALHDGFDTNVDCKGCSRHPKFQQQQQQNQQQSTSNSEQIDWNGWESFVENQLQHSILDQNSTNNIDLEDEEPAANIDLEIDDYHYEISKILQVELVEDSNGESSSQDSSSQRRRSEK